LKKSAGRALERGWIAEMLAGTRLGVAGANIGNLAASHLPFASHPPATVAENWRMPAKFRLVASAPPVTGASVGPACSQPVPSVCAQSLSSALPAVYFYWGVCAHTKKG